MLREGPAPPADLVPEGHTGAGQCTDRAGIHTGFGHLSGQAVLPGCHSSQDSSQPPRWAPATALPAAPALPAVGILQAQSFPPALAAPRSLPLTPPGRFSFGILLLPFLELSWLEQGWKEASRDLAPGSGWARFEVLGCSGMPQQEFCSLLSFPVSCKDIAEPL